MDFFVLIVSEKKEKSTLFRSYTGSDEELDRDTTRHDEIRIKSSSFYREGISIILNRLEVFRILIDIWEDRKQGSVTRDFLQEDEHIDKFFFCDRFFWSEVELMNHGELFCACEILLKWIFEGNVEYITVSSWDRLYIEAFHDDHKCFFS